MSTTTMSLNAIPPTTPLDSTSPTFARFLPPELLHSIFTLLGPPSGDLHLDLLACSLVCKSWHFVALSLIPPTAFESILKFPPRSTRAELDRFADLLHTTHQQHLKLFDHVRGVRLDLRHLLFSAVFLKSPQTQKEAHYQDAEHLLLRLLRPLAPRLTWLAFDFRSISRIDPSNLLHLARLFSAARPYARTVTRLTLLDNGTDHRRDGYHIRPLLTPLSDTLRHLELRSVSLDASLVESVRRCTSIIRARITGHSTPHIWRITSAWPHLESLHLRIQSDPDHHLGRLLHATARACPQLSRLKIVDDGTCSALDVALAGAVERWRHLHELTVEARMPGTAWLLAQLLVDAPGLLHLSVDNSEAGTTPSEGEFVVDEARVRMRRVRTITVKGADVPREFVEVVLRCCPEIERLVLPKHLEALDEVRLALAAKDFERAWRDEMWAWVPMDTVAMEVCE